MGKCAILEFSYKATESYKSHGQHLDKFWFYMAYILEYI